MRRQQRPRAPAQRHRDVAARADAVLAVVPHVGRVARASVSGRQVSADCAGTRVSAFSPPRRGALCAAWPFTHVAPAPDKRAAAVTPGDPEDLLRRWASGRLRAPGMMDAATLAAPYPERILHFAMGWFDNDVPPPGMRHGESDGSLPG